jgi:hypothetical protein
MKLMEGERGLWVVEGSGIKYLSKNTLKYYLRSFLGYLYFTIYI